MTMDPISDMLTRIRNAGMARQARVDMPYSKIKAAIATILTAHNYIGDTKVIGEIPHKVLSISLRTDDKPTVVNGLVRISKPGRRMYVKSTDIPTVLSGRGLVILSTPSGVMTGQEARKKRLGGELICKVW